MSLARDITTVGGGTLISRLLAYLRDAWIAALLGTGPFSEVFFVVLQVVNFFRRLLSEGVLNSAFVPIWLRLRSGEDGAANANRFTISALTAVGTITGILVLLATVGAPFIIAVIAPGFEPALQQHAVLLLMIVAPYILFAGLVAVAAAALSAEGRVAAVAVTTVLFNLVLLFALMLMGRSREPFLISFWLAVAVAVAGLVQLSVAGIAIALSGGWRRTRVHAPDHTGVFIRRALPGLIAAGIPQLKLIAAAAIASASPAAVSWLYYANRLYELPLGVVSIAVAAVILPHISTSVHSGNDTALAAAQSRAYEIAAGLALPAAAGFALLADQIAGGLFERGAFTVQDTTAVAGALMAICIGLPGHVLEKVLGAVSFAHEDTRTPMLAALVGLATAIVTGVLLFPRFGHIGIAGAIGASAWAGAGLLTVILRRRGWLRLDAAAARRLPRIGLATVIMAAVVFFAVHALGPAVHSRLAVLVALIMLGIAIYVVSLQLLGVTKIKDLAAAIRRRT
ncbi:MAG TPA: murein biosynthesis integral membrane protein MurJ [Pseudolabrys sp.]|nr:murein biosynthesis integral membrane protein MurJ [Pseudolabrys sp.]